MTHRRDFLKMAGALALLPAASLSTREAALAAPGRSGGRLFVSLVPEPAGLVGGLYHANPSIVVSQNIFDGLVTYDADLNPVPQLATSWTQSADGKTITLALRQGVKWHDGAPFTAADVKFSIETIKATSPIAGPTYPPSPTSRPPTIILWCCSSPTPRRRCGRSWTGPRPSCCRAISMRAHHRSPIR